jgi:hypothetical protein
MKRSGLRWGRCVIPTSVLSIRAMSESRNDDSLGNASEALKGLPPEGRIVVGEGTSRSEQIALQIPESFDLKGIR